MHAKHPSFSFFLLLLRITLLFSSLVTPSSSDPDSLIYGGCTKLNFNPGSPYESNVNSVLTSIGNSAASTSYKNFKASSSGSKQGDTVYGLYQCRGDLSNSDCKSCVSTAVSQLGNTCPVATGGVVQLDGCFVRYDNISFVGVEDQTVVVDNCGPSIGYDSQRDAVLTSLTNQGQYYRVGGSGNVEGVAQCTQDLSVSKCQDCLSNAIGRLRSECGASSKGDMFLATCYARFSELGSPTKSDNNNSGKNYDHYYDHDHDDNDDHVQRTLAIIVAIIVVVVVLVLLISCWSRHLDKKYGK